MNTDSQQVVHSDRDLLFRYLAEQQARCPRCRSELVGLLAAMCPTCCLRLELCVRADEPYLRAWATLTVALGLSGGVGLFFIMGSIASGLQFRHYQAFAVAAMIFHIASIPLTIGVVLCRHRFVKLPSMTQWLVAVVGVVAAALALATMIASDL